MIVITVNCSSDSVLLGLKITKMLLDLLVPVKAFRPSGLVFISHFETTIATIAIDQGVNH